MDHFIDVVDAKRVYEAGGNVANYLKQRYGSFVPLSDIIEVAYDLQAGTYVEMVKNNREFNSAYCKEVSDLISDAVGSAGVSTILDVGTGELTTLCDVASLLDEDIEYYAFDISISRLRVGRSYVVNNFSSIMKKMSIFSADIGAIPLPSNSIDLVISSHALEPNRAQQDLLVKEVFRVAKGRVMLFEPCYEIASKEGQARMDAHGYIKDLDSSIAKAGGRVLKKIPLQSSSDPLNPTVCYSAFVDKDTFQRPCFSAPGTDYVLTGKGGWLSGPEAGVCFPVFDGLPCLRRKNALVVTQLS